jgi:hypothetical protein
MCINRIDLRGRRDARHDCQDITAGEHELPERQRLERLPAPLIPRPSAPAKRNYQTNPSSTRTSTPARPGAGDWKRQAALLLLLSCSSAPLLSLRPQLVEGRGVPRLPPPMLHTCYQPAVRPGVGLLG